MRARYVLAFISPAFALVLKDVVQKGAMCPGNDDADGEAVGVPRSVTVKFDTGADIIVNHGNLTLDGDTVGNCEDIPSDSSIPTSITICGRGVFKFSRAACTISSTITEAAVTVDTTGMSDGEAEGCQEMTPEYLKTLCGEPDPCRLGSVSLPCY